MLRRRFITGIAAALAAPAIVRAEVLMPIYVPKVPFIPAGFLPMDGRILIREQYRQLFDLIAANYGADFMGNVRVPDLPHTIIATGIGGRKTFHNSGATFEVPPGEIFQFFDQPSVGRQTK